MKEKEMTQEEYVKILKDIVSNLQRTNRHRGFATLDTVIAAGTKEYKVWLDLHSQRYPENYWEEIK